jgi:hypothetical protein
LERDYNVARRQYIQAVRELILALARCDSYRKKAEYAREAKAALHDCRIAWLDYSSGHSALSEQGNVANL